MTIRVKSHTRNGKKVRGYTKSGGGKKGGGAKASKKRFLGNPSQHDVLKSINAGEKRKKELSSIKKVRKSGGKTYKGLSTRRFLGNPSAAEVRAKMG